MELKTVTLNKMDTCLTYALRRLGLPPDMCTYETFNEHFHQIPWRARRKDLHKGAILLWDKNVKWVWTPIQITEERQIISKLIPKGFHFAVYEGDNLISDCTRLHSISPPNPSLRLRHLNTLKSNPDWILVYDPK